MDSPAVLAFAVLALALIVFAAWPRAEFVLRIREGKVEVAKGTPPPQFTNECRRLCETWNVRGGAVKGMRRGRRIRLEFDREVPGEHHQRFRNLWGLYGRS
jgi:hypothetical protein